MSYEFYKILHLMSLILFTASTVAIIYGQHCGKSCKITNGVSSLLLLVAGMGLIARIGYSHGELWPTWIYVKIVLWLIATIWSVSAPKRLPKHQYLVSTVFLLLIFGTVVTAVLQPWD